MEDYLNRANKSLTSLEESIRINASSQRDLYTRIYNSFLQTRYILENIPDVVFHPDKTIKIKEFGEIKVSQLLSAVLCERISDISDNLNSDLQFGEEIEIKVILRELYDLVARLSEVAEIQQKLADGTPVSTETVKNLEKKYNKRIKQLQDELLRKDGRALTISALDTTHKPKLFGKSKFYQQLGDLVLEYGKKLKSSSGGYISLANLYTGLKNQIPDVEFSPKDLDKACAELRKKKLIQGVSDRSGVKIIEFEPVSLSKDATKVFNLATQRGFVTIEEVMIGTKWDQQRTDRVLKNLVESNIARKVTSLDTGDRYYFPGLYGDDDW